MNTERVSLVAATTSALAAVASIATAYIVHREDLAVSREALRVAEATLKSEQSWRKRPLLLFDAADRDVPTLTNFGNGPALYVGVRLGDEDRASLTSDHLAPDQHATVSIETNSPVRSRRHGTVDITCTDIDGMKCTFAQNYVVDVLNDGKHRWRFMDVARVEYSGKPIGWRQPDLIEFDSVNLLKQ